MYQKIVLFILLMSLNVLIAGCGGGDDDDDNDTTTSEETSNTDQVNESEDTAETDTEQPVDANQQRVQSLLATSLHGTTRGMKHFYSTETGGFEQFTGLSYEQLGCKEGCHVEPIAAGDCQACHTEPGDTPTNETCLGCHKRQTNEQKMAADHHLTIGLKCVDCHSAAQIHGDGVAYNSMHENPNKVNCQQSNCHETLTSKPMHDTHSDDLDCAACHVSTVLTCYNCHIPSTPNDFVKPIANWKMLVKRTSDGKITTGNFQSLTTPQGKSAYTIAPYFAHTIQKESGLTCSTCHDSGALQEYKEHGAITLTTWNETEKSLQSISGVIPVPLDWRTALKMDFLVRGADGQWTHQGQVPDAARIMYADPIDVANMPRF